MRDYRDKLVKGWLTDGKHLGIDIPVRVRMTSDDKGQSLSLTTEMNPKDVGIQIGIPLEAVRDIIRVVEKDKEDFAIAEFEKIKAEIENMWIKSSKDLRTGEVIYENLCEHSEVLEIIDKHISELKGEQK